MNSLWQMVWPLMWLADVIAMVACLWLKFKFCSWENYLNYMYTNRIRNIHAYIVSEYGKESVKIFQWWEKKTEMKMVDFQNHKTFSLRCHSKDITLVSVKLGSNVKTPKGNFIARKAEKALLNERVKSINNTITMFKYQIDTVM